MHTIDKSQAIANQRKETSMSTPSIAESTIGPVKPVSSQRSTLSRSLLTIGAAGPIVFLAVATLTGLLDPSYNMAGQAMSELALGPNGWLMTANFFVFGLAIIAFAIGFFRVVVVGRMVWYTARDVETRKDLHHGYEHNDMLSLRQYNASQVWNRAKWQAKISLPHLRTPKS